MELTLEDLQSSLKEWTGCPLHKMANPVLGEGNPKAEVMFIGEAPGQKENELGRPFVGPAGELLNELLASIGLKREDVYISNIVKYRPPGNRDPTPEEKEMCMPWLKLEIALIMPSIIVPLGRHALGQFFPKLNMGTAHGKPQKLNPKGGSEKMPDMTIFPIYHPAAALHNANMKEALSEDFKALKAFLDSRKKPQKK